MENLVPHARDTAKISGAGYAVYCTPKPGVSNRKSDNEAAKSRAWLSFRQNP
jgi:hypothetical protein